MRLNCALEPSTRQLIAAAHAHIGALSSERLRRELQLVFDERRAAEILIQLNDLGLLSAIHPVLANTADAWLADKLAVAGTGAEAADVSWLLWLFRMPADAAQAVAQRLRLPVRLTAALREAQQLGADPGLRRELKASALVALLAGIHDSALAVLDIAAQDEGVRHNVRRYRSELRHIKPLVTGKVLRARGMAAGPRYSKVLGRLRDAWLDGEICDAAGELALLDFFLSQS
jgi:tRNA nucleotidyltransferase/poly(A) polymerase